MVKSILNIFHKHIAFIVLGFFSLMFSGIALSADQSSQQQGMGQGQSTGAQKQNGEQELYKVSILRDRDVKNKNGEELGEITDLAISKSGQIEYGVLSHGGTLGMEQKMTAVPWDKLQISKEGRYYTLDVSKKQLADAPTLNKGKWPNKAQWTPGSANP
jgi:sporulation protein YlmC with PRC-barrel domain